MKITILLIGKTDEGFVKQGFELYEKRIKHYINLTTVVISDIKNAGKMPQEELKLKEGELILKQLQASDFVLLLDDKGKQYTSIEYSKYLQKLMNAATKNLVVLVGGAFGFSEKVYARANGQISLSKMTLTHQMVRLFFAEQTYRAMTIIKGESYHHE